MKRQHAELTNLIQISKKTYACENTATQRQLREQEASYNDYVKRLDEL